MKVVFKLNAEQLSRAQEICERVAKENEGLVFELESPRPKSYYDSAKKLRFYFRGNMLPCQADEFNYNKDQNLSLSDNILTYTGQRCPLWDDGGIEVLKEIAFGEIEELEVVEYDTSDCKMLWHDTASSYIRRKAKCPKTLLSLLLKHPATGGYLEEFLCFRVTNVVETVEAPEYMFEKHDIEVFEDCFLYCASRMIPGKEKAASAWLKNRKARKQIYDFCVEIKKDRGW